jgi:CheY-like chemotaxis protein
MTTINRAFSRRCGARRLRATDLDQRKGDPPPMRLTDIVLVLDDRLEASLLAEQLHEQGLWNEIRSLHDGEAAARYLSSSAESIDQPTPILLLGLRLARRDGFELLRMIRDDPALSRIPVGVLGTEHLEGALLRQHGLRVDALLDTPVAVADVVALARKAPDLHLAVGRVISPT